LLLFSREKKRGAEQWDSTLSVLESLRPLGCGLTELCLDIGGNHLGEVTLNRLGSLLSSFVVLRTLSLGLQGLLLGPTTCNMTALSHLSELPLLGDLRLCLGYCNIGDAGVGQLLGHGFPSLQRLTLDLRSNDIGDVGAVILAMWLVRLSPQLRDVDVCLSVNSVTNLGARSVRYAMLAVPNTILWLQHNLCDSLWEDSV
jgi:hypothetical protein